MKHILSATLLLLLFSSCKKDFVCNCVDTSGIEPLFPEINKSYSNLNKSEAEEAENNCNSDSLSPFYSCTWTQE